MSINDYYKQPGALRAAEARAEMMATEVENMRKEMKTMRTDYDANVLRNRLIQIATYDEQVRLIISAHPILQEAWDNFRIQYQLTASKALLETAHEKIHRNEKGRCHGCKRDFPGNTEEDRQQVQRDRDRIKVLEYQIASLEEEIAVLKGDTE
jgi:hypothetical protein